MLVSRGTPACERLRLWCDQVCARSHCASAVQTQMRAVPKYRGPFLKLEPHTEFCLFFRSERLRLWCDQVCARSHCASAVQTQMRAVPKYRGPFLKLEPHTEFCLFF